MNIDQQWRDASRTINRSIRQNGRLPRQYQTGDKVRRDLDGQVYTVKRSYWQNYAGDTSDWTTELESIDPSQSTPWDKSTNLEPVSDKVMSDDDKIVAAVESLGTEVFHMCCGVVAIEVSKIIGREVEYAEVEAALKVANAKKGK